MVSTGRPRLRSSICTNKWHAGSKLVVFPVGVRRGIDEDDLVAVQLGKAKAAQLTDVQQKYKDRLKEKLAQVLVDAM